MHTYRLTVYTLHTYIHINHTPIYKYTYTYIHTSLQLFSMDTVTDTVPASGVNFNAFESKLRITCDIL